MSSVPAPKRKPGRPPGARNKSIDAIRAENGVLLDKLMNKILREGVTVQDPATGEIVKVPPSAAMMNAIRSRCRDIQNTAKHGRVNEAAGELVRDAMARSAGLRLTGTDPAPTPDQAFVRDRLADALNDDEIENDRDPEDDLVVPKRRAAQCQ